MPRRACRSSLRARLALMACALLSLALVACDDSSGSGNNNNTTQDTGTATDTEPADTSPQDSSPSDTGGGDDDTGGGGATTTAADTSGGDDTQDTSTTDVEHGDVTSLVIRPETVTLEVVNGVVVPQDFSAIAVHEDGFEREVSAVWRFDRAELGRVSAQGLLTPTGQQGGRGTLTATSGALETSAEVHIVLRHVINDDNLSAEEQAVFDAPDGDPSGTLLYPYDKTMFARGILPPELQWEGGDAGDRYRVRISEESMVIEAYIVSDPPSAWLPPTDVWTQLTQTNAGEPVEVSITRVDGEGQAHAPMQQQWHVAQGSLKGTIYYWAVNRGRLMKINPGSDTPEPVFDSGPADELGSVIPANYDGTMPPWTVGSDGNRCVSCHTVSRNGNAVAAVFETKGVSPSPWGLINLQAEPEPQLELLSDYGDNTIWVALDPDARWAVSNKNSFRMELVDTTTNTVVPSALDSAQDPLADPAFSPDGRKLAFASRVLGFYPVEYYRADLDVMDFDPATGTFTNRREIAAGNDEAIAFPSFTPDSNWVIFQKGSYSRAKYGSNSVGRDNLFMVDLDGTVGPLRLDNLNGDAYLPPHNHDLNYEPRVNPIAVGGYAWVVFMSPRDYGHRMRSTSNPTYENRKQLWVAAVNLNPQPGEDPSHPAFWLPGQDLSTINMSGFWALEPCRGDGEGCEAGFECCTGFCQADGSGDKVCVPPGGQCSDEGDACITSADCCTDGPRLECQSGFCGRIIN